MLQGNFYTVSAPVTEGNVFKATLQLNADHPIFKGHFPDQPVVPGVCMIQIVKELITGLTGKQLNLQKADFLKFLTMINPLETLKVNVELKYVVTEDEKMIRVDAQLFNDTTVYFKFKGTFAAQQ